jgi:phosphoribosyl-dephospho-CoA transferase
LIKETIDDQLLDEWFTKYLFPLISCDVVMGGVIKEEEAIAHA